MSKKTKTRHQATEKDSVYFLKLVIYILAGTLWIKFQDPMVILGLTLNGLPLGLLLGVLFASHDHFQMDRKIEYAVLLIVTILSYFLPAGIVL
ncbi:MAG TPA: hypothetical protein VFZ48_01175 [Candidatus Saccharimonadales bacterium]